jgi:hypothetical protein
VVIEDITSGAGHLVDVGLSIVVHGDSHGRSSFLSAAEHALGARHPGSPLHPTRRNHLGPETFPHPVLPYSHLPSQGTLSYGTGNIDDYSSYWANARKVFDQRNGRQPGAPDKLGAALVKVVNSENPPLRFVAGPDAVAIVEQKPSSVAAELAEWRDLSLSTSF